MNFHDPFDPDAARQAAADVAYPDDGHGNRVGRQWPQPAPVTIRGSDPHVGPTVRQLSLDTWLDNNQAACRDASPDWFFPDSVKLEPRAVAICQRCPLMALCREHGIRYEAHGVWGGLGEAERRAERRRLHIGRAGRTA